MSKKARDPFPDDDDYEAWRYDDNLPVPDLDAPGSQRSRIMARRRAVESGDSTKAAQDGEIVLDPSKLPSVAEFDKILATAQARATATTKSLRPSSPIQDLMRKSLRLNHPQLTDEEIEDALQKM